MRKFVDFGILGVCSLYSLLPARVGVDPRPLCPAYRDAVRREGEACSLVLVMLIYLRTVRTGTGVGL